MLVQNLIFSVALVLSEVNQSTRYSETSEISPWNQRYSAATLSNNTGCTITYSVRWGQGAWQNFTLLHGQCLCHYWTIEPRSQFVPRMEISFDSDFGNWNYYKQYSLISEFTYNIDCVYGSQYYFEVAGGGIELFKN